MLNPNPVLRSINESADEPSVAVYLPVPLAEKLIELVGGERESTPGRGHDARWIFPDGFVTWATDEALRYALELAPDVVDWS